MFPTVDAAVAAEVVRRLNEMLPSQVLDAAAEVIAEHGWTTREDRERHVHVEAYDVIWAIRGALGWQSQFRNKELTSNDARGQMMQRYQVESEIWLHLLRNTTNAAQKVYFTITSCLMEITGYGDVTAWNDEVCSGQDEALDVLARAAELARSRGA